MIQHLGKQALVSGEHYAAAPYESALMGDECACPSCRSETLRIPQPVGLQRIQFVEFNEVQP